LENREQAALLVRESSPPACKGCAREGNGLHPDRARLGEYLRELPERRPCGHHVVDDEQPRASNSPGLAHREGACDVQQSIVAPETDLCGSVSCPTHQAVRDARTERTRHLGCLIEPALRQASPMQRNRDNRVEGTSIARQRYRQEPAQRPRKGGLAPVLRAMDRARQSAAMFIGHPDAWRRIARDDERVPAQRAQSDGAASLGLGRMRLETADAFSRREQIEQIAEQLAEPAHAELIVARCASLRRRLPGSRNDPCAVGQEAVARHSARLRYVHDLQERRRDIADPPPRTKRERRALGAGRD